MQLQGPPLDPDRELARRWMQDELDRPGYSTSRSWVSRALEWISERLPSLDLPGQLPAWTAWVALAAVLVAAVALIAFGMRRRWRRASLTDSRPAPGAVLEEALSAADYRARADAALARGDHDAALVDRYRAIAAGAVERTLLDDRPGRTAHEVAVDLSPVFPAVTGALAMAADRFDEVRYGEGRADAGQARAMADLDQRLAATRPELAAAQPAQAAPPREPAR